MATEIYCIVECKVTYNNGTTQIHRPSYSELSVGLANVDKISVIDYLRNNLKNVSKIEVIDTYYFKRKDDYLKYLSS